jgi:HPt (histidine-containing phosphotransfer) domain-containing protein
MDEEKTPGTGRSQPLRSHYADDPDMTEIIELFVGEMPRRLNELAACWEQRELERLTHLVHQLKGASGGYGFPAVGRAAGQLEQTLRQLVERGSAVGPPQLQSEFNRLLELCRSMSVR